MRIHNARLGHATNSSSTHSIILLGRGEMLATDERSDFGWQHFTAADRESRQNYLAHCVRQQLERVLGSESAGVMIDGLFGRPGYAAEIDGGYVDHQSQLTFPAEWDGRGIDPAFFGAFKQWFLAAPIAVLGGNDNTDVSHPLDARGRALSFPTEQTPGDLVARRDGGHWVLFNRRSGAKIRLSLADAGAPEAAPTKAAAPELVDVKITGYCTFGCTYCYQASTAEGAHADRHFLRRLAHELGRMRVFEVAIGGGEPTLHPEFDGILQDFRHAGVVPNFTTRNLAWLADAARAKDILSLIGSFAFSVDGPEDVLRLRKALERVETGQRPVVQYVLESGGDLEGVLREAAAAWFTVVLLGFKEVGFGKGYVRSPEDWVRIVEEAQQQHHCPRLGVDTAVVAQHPEALARLRIPPELVTPEEGKFSMYIDAVTRTMAPSSYCGEAEYAPLGSHADSDAILRSFSRW